MENKFTREMTIGVGSAFTENGALAYASYGTEIGTQWYYAPRYNASYAEISRMMEKLWNENPLVALRFTFYRRMITRKTYTLKGDNKSESVQRGLGNRSESLLRLLWIAEHHFDTFVENIHWLPVVGSWKDMWELLILNEQHLHDEQKQYVKDVIFSRILSGCCSTLFSNLAIKYLPRIQSNKKVKTERAKILNQLAKEFAARYCYSMREYRQIKSSGNAHNFQKLITAQKYDEINFSTIPGIALNKMVNSRFLANHNLIDRYMKWIETKGELNFNGYPYQLVHPTEVFDRNIILKQTCDKQFDNLIATAKADNSIIKKNTLCVVDVSGSMKTTLPSSGSTTLYDIGVGLACYFAELNEGAFHNKAMVFSDVACPVTLPEGGISEKVRVFDEKTGFAFVNTNFQAVINYLVNIRQTHPEIPLEDYPEVLLCVSDMQFDYTCRRNGDAASNIDAAMEKLRSAFPSEWVDNFKFIWWNVASNYNNLPSNIDHKNAIMMSGFDGASINFILGTTDENEASNKPVLTTEEIIKKALEQEILLNLKIAE